MHRLIFLALLTLAACSSRAPDIRTAYRDQGQQIYSNAVLDMAGLQGEWRQVAAFAAAPGGCAPGRVQIGAAQASAARSAAVPLRADLCLGGKRQSYAGLAELPVPGRLIPDSAAPEGITQPWWIIWADTNLRTLVIGTPTGEMGFILDRSGALPADRLAAAREILEWNGYDLTRLQLF